MRYEKEFVVGIVFVAVLCGLGTETYGRSGAERLCLRRAVRPDRNHKRADGGRGDVTQRSRFVDPLRYGMLSAGTRRRPAVQAAGGRRVRTGQGGFSTRSRRVESAVRFRTAGCGCALRRFSRQTETARKYVRHLAERCAVAASGVGCGPLDDFRRFEPVGLRFSAADGGVAERFLGLRNGDPQRENAVGAA